MEFRFIDHKDSLLEQVIELGKRNSQTLGLMPRDAYIDQAKKKCIVVAFNDQKLLGYCLFRLTPTKHRLGITQVCIDPSVRHQGVAKLLLAQVRNKYGSIFNGMLVSCREDYQEACELWLKFGFVKKKRIRSRSAQERYLFKFWYSFGKRDLFSNEETSELLRVALDLNILIKLHDNYSMNDEIRQLTSDWLTDEVDYCYANETFNEIHRDDDFKRTTSMVKFLGTFTELSCDAQEIGPYLKVLEKFHPGETPNQISDRKQVAECKACKVEYFITIDEGLLENRIAIYEELGVNILRPAEFILELDKLKNRHLYEPIRLQGARFEVRNINPGELIEVADAFLKKDKAEKRSSFQNQINSVVAKGKTGQIKVITAPDASMVACYGFYEEGSAVVMPFIRIKKLPLFNTLFYQLLVESIRKSILLKKQLVRVGEKLLNDEQIQILRENGFTEANGEWVKTSIQEIDTFENIISRHKLSERGSNFVNEINILKEHQDSEVRVQLTMDLEKKLWPVKFEDLDIPTFIVPIRPLWASQLFDYFSSNTLLFGSPPELSWSKDNVYYRSVNPNVEKAPARILWYASQQRNFQRSKCIVGCSYLNDISIGGAKKLYSIFRRFGIYTWSEINKLSNGDIDQEIKVLQFSDTEAFVNCISFSKTNEILTAFGFKNQTFVSPVKVNAKVFNEIYRLSR